MFLENTSLTNLFAFIALFLYILTLTPSLLRNTLPIVARTKFNLFLTRQRRHIGVLAWVFAIVHGTLIVFERQLSFSDTQTYIKYFQGLILITIFTFLAVTSNDFSQKKLKRHWKTIHNFTFVALFLLPWHIIDKMSDGWSIFTPFAVGILLVTLYFFGLRSYKQYQMKNKN